MGDLQTEIRRDQAVIDGGLAGVFAGTIAENAADETTKIQVLLDAFDPSLRFGPCAWPTRVTTVTVDVAEAPESAHNITIARSVLPTRGDRCLVAFDDSETPWIVGWWPA